MDALTNLGSDQYLSDSLRRIAGVLDFPMEAFFDDSKQSELGASGEILELWSQIKSEDGRRAVLDFVRVIVAAQEPDSRR